MVQGKRRATDSPSSHFHQRTAGRTPYANLPQPNTAYVPPAPGPLSQGQGPFDPAFNLVGGRKAEFPKGVQRTGYSTELIIKRKDFGMDKMLEAIGDEVRIAISFEGIKK